MTTALDQLRELTKVRMALGDGSEFYRASEVDPLLDQIGQQIKDLEQKLLTELVRSEFRQERDWQLFSLESVTAARDALVGFQNQAGIVSGQDGYSTRMTEAEYKLAEAIQSINALLAMLPAPPVVAPSEKET